MTTEAPTVIMRPAQVAERIGIHRVTLYKWVREGRFPPPAKLGPNTVAWRASTVEAWLDEQFAAAEVT